MIYNKKNFFKDDQGYGQIRPIKAITESIYLCNVANFCPKASQLHPDIKFILIDLHLQF